MGIEDNFMWRARSLITMERVEKVIPFLVCQMEYVKTFYKTTNYKFDGTMRLPYGMAPNTLKIYLFILVIQQIWSHTLTHVPNWLNNCLGHFYSSY